MENTRTGKIARLPADIREGVNQRLFDNEPGSKIIAWLHEQQEVLRVLDEQFGEEPISPNNLSEWRRGGYQDWLDKKDRVENLKILSGYAMKMAEAAGTSVSEGAAAIAAGKLLEYLETTNKEDAIGLSLALAKLRDADAKILLARVAKAKLPQKERDQRLAEQKFQRSTAELFLKWISDRRVREIAEGKGSKDVKMDKLVQLVFGEAPPAGAPSAE